MGQQRRSLSRTFHSQDEVEENRSPSPTPSLPPLSTAIFPALPLQPAQQRGDLRVDDRVDIDEEGQSLSDEVEHLEMRERKRLMERRVKAQSPSAADLAVQMRALDERSSHTLGSTRRSPRTAKAAPAVAGSAVEERKEEEGEEALEEKDGGRWKAEVAVVTDVDVQTDGSDSRPLSSGRRLFDVEQEEAKGEQKEGREEEEVEGEAEEEKTASAPPPVKASKKRRKSGSGGSDRKKRVMRVSNTRQLNSTSTASPSSHSPHPSLPLPSSQPSISSMFPSQRRDVEVHDDSTAPSEAGAVTSHSEEFSFASAAHSRSSRLDSRRHPPFRKWVRVRRRSEQKPCPLRCH